MNRKFITVDFSNGVDSFSIKLYSKFTCIFGLDSGKGKSKLLVDLLDGLVDKSCSVTSDSDIKVRIIDNVDLDDITSIKERRIYVLDEPTSANSKDLLEIYNTDHLFIFICRSLPFKNEYPYHNIYHLNMTDTWYTVSEGNLRMYKYPVPIDTIVTESYPDRSEHELVSKYFPNIIAARGRDRVEKVLRNLTGNVLALVDLGNIGRAYRILCKRCKDNENLYFYDYQAFEELLYYAPLLEQLPPVDSVDIFKYTSIETYYEDVLSLRTRSTDFEYVHGKPLAKPFLERHNFNAVFNSDVGKLLFTLLLNCGNMSKAEVYLRAQAGDKFDLLPTVAVADCKTKQDCDMLLQSLNVLN